MIQPQSLNTENFNEHITQEVIYKEFVKLGMQEVIANDLSRRYYHNELTYKDLEYLGNKFDLKLEKLEDNLKNEMEINKKEMEINMMEIKSTLRLHNWMFGTIITLNLGLILTLIPILYTILKK
ncbi:hypothetical protein DB313_05635 (plasmid) [Borrelia turcica IST7]|uniref:DUF1640 domain-containing protein n=1 Tax=Borrelia turcica IST7 TaxID=1104446 RepID=A0A386PQY5_9SPIR|nr:Bdr family repetitive protein [Borrelia turcica]AYE36980.1 hypothetical protein DB313_05635 [Borrelia turcica IST7]